MQKLIPDWDELARTLDRLRTDGAQIVFTNGCFDILHVGHIRYLQEARALGEVLVVGLNTDASVQKLKGPTRPVQTQSARGEIMAALECVDLVTFFNDDTPEKLIQVVRPRVLVKGGDWTIDKIVGAAFVQSYGGTVKSLQFTYGQSTSAIIEKIKS